MSNLSYTFFVLGVGNVTLTKTWDGFPYFEAVEAKRQAHFDRDCTVHGSIVVHPADARKLLVDILALHGSFNSVQSPSLPILVLLPDHNTAVHMHNIESWLHFSDATTLPSLL